MKKIIIGLTGHIACGKGTTAKYLVQKYGAREVRFSNSLRDILARLNVDATRENLQKLSTLLRAEFGQDLLSKVIVNDITNNPAEIIVIDGIRRPQDVSEFKSIEGFNLIAIESDERTRYERSVSRSENEGDAKMPFEEFQQKEKWETETTIDEVMTMAEFKIVNSGSLEDLYDQVDKLMKIFGYESKN